MSGKEGNGAPAKLSKTFDLTTPKAYVRAARNPAALRMLTGIEKRADAIRARALDHHKRFEDRWTAKEAMRLWARHHAQSASHPAPEGARRDVTPEAFMKIASHQVQARTNRRLSKINDIKTRMSNALVRNLKAVSLKRSFENAAPTHKQSRSPRRSQ